MAKSMVGKVVLITGASSGIGAALAREVAARGARPVLLARRVDRIEALARDLREAGGQALAMACDVARDGEVERAAERARAELGSIDVVVANAGFGVIGRIDALTIEDHRRQLETNVFGVLRTIYATLDDLKRSRGCLALVGSVSAYLSTPETGAYAMSKAAVRALADTLYAELQRDGVAVLHVAPGFVESEIRYVDNQGALDASMKDPTPAWLHMPTPRAARQIADAIAARRREVVLTGHGKLGVALARHAPGLVAAAAVAAARRARVRPAKA
jgi:short-subunit dehydrogenase